MSFTVTVKDDDVKQALAALQQRLNNMQPAMQGIGETIMERAKRRFDTSTAPDGTPWQPLSASTYLSIINNLDAKHWKKDGSLNKKGLTKMGGRKPLVDEGDLSRQFFVSADQTSVTVSNTMVYAAIHQFGGMAGRNRQVKIPARPFLPVSAAGDLDATEREQVLQVIADYLSEAP
jgi:phage virion morphogenesis protein